MCLTFSDNDKKNKIFPQVFPDNVWDCVKFQGFLKKKTFMSSHYILYKPVGLLWFLGGVTLHHSLHKLCSLTCDTGSKNQACVHEMDGDKSPPHSLRCTGIKDPLVVFHRGKEVFCDGLGFKWSAGGGGDGRWQIDIVHSECEFNSGTLKVVFLISFLLYVIAFDVTLLFSFFFSVLDLWFRSLNLQPLYFGPWIQLTVLSGFFQSVFPSFLSEEGLYSMFFLCLQSTMAGDKHRIFTGVKGPFLWWKLFLFPQ